MSGTAPRFRILRAIGHSVSSPKTQRQEWLGDYAVEWDWPVTPVA